MRRFIARQKFRFDLGHSFLSILNFIFVVIAASDKIGTLVHLPARAIVCAAVPVSVIGVWCFGWILDRCRFWQAYQSETNDRNEMLKDVWVSRND